MSFQHLITQDHENDYDDFKQQYCQADPNLRRFSGVEDNWEAEQRSEEDEESTEDEDDDYVNVDMNSKRAI